MNTKRFSTPRNTETAEYTHPHKAPRNTAQHTAQHRAKFAKRLCNFIIGYEWCATPAQPGFYFERLKDLFCIKYCNNSNNNTNNNNNITAALAVDREFVYIETGRRGGAAAGRTGGRDGTEGGGGGGGGQGRPISSNFSKFHTISAKFHKIS